MNLLGAVLASDSGRSEMPKIKAYLNLKLEQICYALPLLILPFIAAIDNGNGNGNG